MTTTNPTASMTAPSAANQVCELLRNLCKAKRDIDRFYEASDAGSFIRECPGPYLTAEGHLSDALGLLFDYVGNYMYDEFVKALDHEI
jgi:hypothetical protein